MIKRVDFDEIKRINLNHFPDDRGFFVETFNAKFLKTYEINDKFVQDNLSLSLKKNTFRGFHFQIPPFEQSKLVNVIRGSILDIYIDLRKNSETYQCYGSCELNSENGLLYIPRGFAHGFLTLMDDTIVSYKVDNYYDIDSERGIRFNDDFFSLDFNLSLDEIIISEKDKNLPLWVDISEEINF